MRISSRVGCSSSRGTGDGGMSIIYIKAVKVAVEKVGLAVAKVEIEMVEELVVL